MKNINALKALLFISISALLFSTGCTHVKPSATAALVGLHLHTFIDTNLVDPSNLNVYYHDHTGRSEKLYYAQLFITNISFHSVTTGQWVVIPNSLILKREEQEEYPLDNIPADTYDDVRFTIGLNSMLNSGSPSGYPVSGTSVDTVLSANENFMWFGTGEGYKFVAIGGVDSSSGIPFSYAIGGTGDTVLITMPQQSFSIAPNIPAVQYVHIIFDYGKLLQGIQITNPTYSTGNSFGNATQKNAATIVLDSIVNMVRYECTTPNGVC